jgi:hypothetical protein
MSHWKKAALAMSSALTLLALAVLAAPASGGGGVLQAIGAKAALAATTSGVDAQAGGGAATSTGLGPIQMSIGPDWTLQGKLSLSGSLTVTCGPFLPDQSESSSASVSISEAAGHTIAHASGSISPACDGATHTYVVMATAQDVPFRPGTGTASANAFACGTDLNSFQFMCQDGQASGQVSIKK